MWTLRKALGLSVVSESALTGGKCDFDAGLQCPYFGRYSLGCRYECVCHLHSHPLGILWFLSGQAHEVVHDFMMKCKFNVSGTGGWVVCRDPHSLFQQRVLAKLLKLLLCHILGFLLGKQKCSLLAKQAVQNFYSSSELELFLSLKSYMMNSVSDFFLCCGRNFTGTHSWDLPSPLSARPAHTLLCQGLCGDSRATVGHVTMSCHTVSGQGNSKSCHHRLIICLLGALRGQKSFLLIFFFFSKMKRLIVCQSNYAVVLAWIPCSQHSVQFQTGSLHQNVSVCAWFHRSCQI